MGSYYRGGPLLKVALVSLIPSLTSECSDHMYTLCLPFLIVESVYIYNIHAHTSIHSLPDADMANKLPRKPLQDLMFKCYRSCQKQSRLNFNQQHLLQVYTS